jgi:hypothetical protein
MDPLLDQIREKERTNYHTFGRVELCIKGASKYG